MFQMLIKIWDADQRYLASPIPIDEIVDLLQLEDYLNEN